MPLNLLWIFVGFDLWSEATICCCSDCALCKWSISIAIYNIHLSIISCINKKQNAPHSFDFQYTRLTRRIKKFIQHGPQSNLYCEINHSICHWLSGMRIWIQSSCREWSRSFETFSIAHLYSIYVYAASYTRFVADVRWACLRHIQLCMHGENKRRNVYKLAMFYTVLLLCNILSLYNTH